MKRDWKQNPFVVAGLLAVAVLIWGIFLLRVQGGDLTITSPDPTAGPSNTERTVSLGELPYPDVYQDPFAPFGARTMADEVSDEPEPRRPPRIEHQLQGVIGGTALLLDPAGATHVVRRGDTVGELEILRVHSGHVEVRLNGHRLDLTLE